MIRSLISAVAVAAALASAAPALAQVTGLDVRYDDLNLATDQGAATLHDRVVAAAARACGQIDSHDLVAASRIKACRRGRVDDSEASVKEMIAKAKAAQTPALAAAAPAPAVPAATH